MTPTGNGNPTTPGATSPGAVPPDAAATGSTASASSHMKDRLGEAGGHLRQAARDSGDALKGAAGAAGDELRLGRAHVKADLADGALAGIAAAEHAGDAAREQTDELMEKGRDLLDSASALIRERPLASFGAALAAGWIIARLTRSSDK